MYIHINIYIQVCSHFYEGRDSATKSFFEKCMNINFPTYFEVPEYMLMCQTDLINLRNTFEIIIEFLLYH